MRDLVHKAALAGLLHDVGKLARLGGEQSSWRKYAHAELGDRFVQKYVPPQWQESLAPVGWHHGEWSEEKKEKHFDETTLPLVKVVALADRLASGEREVVEEREQRVKQLLTVFSRVRVGETLQGPKAWFRPAPLSLREDTIFPCPNLPTSEATEAFHDLWSKFCSQAQALSQVYAQDGVSIESYLESMFFVLRDHAWCAPSAYWDVEPDVSLFSHLHATSALAAVLAHDFWDQMERVGELLEAIKLAAIKGDPWPEEPEVALLAVGDIAGIQNFIYSLHDPKGAAAILRARSFFIQILNEVLARHILRKLGLPITCALYIGGGKFTLLLPSSAKDRLSGMRAEMSKVVRQGIGLELVMAWTPLVPRDFQLPPETKNRNEQLPGIAIKLHDVLERELARQKMRKLSDLDEAELVKFFAPKGLGGRAEDSSSPTVVCNVCGREVPRTEIKLVEDVRFCRLCSELKDLGDQLKRARYLRLRAIEPQSLRTESPTLSELLRALGFALEVWTDPPAAPEPSAVVWGLVEPEADISLEKLCGPSQAAGRRFLANFVPLVKDEKELAEIREIFEKSKRVEEVEGLGVGDVKHFGILARQARGAPYIAVLRMDMDNLGRVFGLPPCPNDKNHVVRGLGRFVTLSRIATLSFFVSLFFEGWVEKIAKDMEKDGHDRLYAVYSGGDDLCFVGSWDAVFDFAYRVRRDFARFAAREDLGVSAGIYFCHEKYPLFLAARKADEAQERAKHLRDKKDALSFLGLEVGWEQFEGLQKRAEQLISFVREGRLPREVLRRVLELYEQYRRERDKRGEWGPWVWRAEYWLARFCERAKDEEVKTWVEGKMKAELGGERFSENTVVWALAARWAELATRR